MRVRNIRSEILRGALLLFASALFAASGRSELMISPSRLVFEGSQRAAQVDLINTGDKETTYRISVVNRRMTETGSFVDVEEPGPGEHLANEMIRFSPKQVTLPPGIAQSVRLMVRRPADLESGEYRTHLLFRALPPAHAAPEVGEPPTGISVGLVPVYGLSIPIIIRQGKPSASLSIEHVSLERSGKTTLIADLVRSGDRSVYGDITTYQIDAKGDRTVIGIAKGVAVYTPNRVRHARLPLTLDLKARGTILVVFQERGDGPGTVIAQASIPMQ